MNQDDQAQVHLSITSNEGGSQSGCAINLEDLTPEALRDTVEGLLESILFDAPALVAYMATVEEERLAASTP